jgi:hypothetical protein
MNTAVSAVAPVLVLVLTILSAGLAMLAVSWVIAVALFVATPRMKLPPLAPSAAEAVPSVSAAATASTVNLPLENRARSIVLMGLLSWLGLGLPPNPFLIFPCPLPSHMALTSSSSFVTPF